MRIKRLCIILFILVTFIYIDSVSASSIDYTLKIDKNRHFYETVTYSIEKNTSSEYLKYVLNNKMYFDVDNKYMYKKAVTSDGENFIVQLKYDYPSVNLKKSKILNTCFNEFVYKETSYRITYYASDPFICINRADKITINVISDIKVILDTASEVVGNRHTWHPSSDKFLMDMSVGEYDPDDETGAPIADTSIMSPDSKTITDHPAIDLPFSYTPIIIISVLVGVIVVVISFGIVKNKKNRNKNAVIEYDEF